MLTILQIPKFCTAFFNYNFCYVNNFKYFLLCIMLPVLIGLFVWWTPEMAHAVCPNKCETKTDTDKILQEFRKACSSPARKSERLPKNYYI